MSDLYPFSVRCWCDIYQVLRAKAEAERGTVAHTPNGALTGSFPRTTARDAFAIAMVFDQAVTDSASSHTAKRWAIETELLAGEADDDTIYVGNRSLWDTLAAAAIDLDAGQVKCPPPNLIDAALHQLATHPDAPPRPRNAANAHLLTVFEEPTWRAMAARQVGFFRALRGEERDTSRGLPAVPCTRNADVLALADYWTTQLACRGQDAHDTFHRLLHSAWREVLHQVKSAERLPASETYAHNHEFWTSLLLLTTQSDARDAKPAPWAFDVPAMSDDPVRNAAPVDTGATLDFPAAKTWDEAAQMQRDAFAKLRGEDRVTGRKISRVPRTTLADVRQLAAFWTQGLARVGFHNFADISYRHVIDRWDAARAQLDRIPASLDPASVYPHNTDFWEALMTIAIQVAVTAEAPTRWQLAKESVKDAVSNLPDTLRSALQGFLGKLLAKPLLYAGIGVGGIVITALLLRRSQRAPEPSRESRP